MSDASETPLPSYPAGHTALLFVDPYNDFLSEGGKIWPMVAEVARSVGLQEHLRAITTAARRAGIPIFIVPHHRAEPDDFASWQHPTPYQLQSARLQVFAKDSWGGEWHPDFAPRKGDFVAKEHWSGSGFANTDLDLLLKQQRISQIVLVGLIANTCVESTARAAVDLGYHVTLVRDATAAFSREAMHAAHEINAPGFAHAVLGTAQLFGALPKQARA